MPGRSMVLVARALAALAEQGGLGPAPSRSKAQIASSRNAEKSREVASSQKSAARRTLPSHDPLQRAAAAAPPHSPMIRDAGIADAAPRAATRREPAARDTDVHWAAPRLEQPEALGRPDDELVSDAQGVAPRAARVKEMRPRCIREQEHPRVSPQETAARRRPGRPRRADAEAGG